MELQSYFKNMSEYSQSQINSGKSYSNDKKGSLLNLCSAGNRGTAVIRPIVDINGIPMRPVQNLYEVYETFNALDEKGEQIYREDGTPQIYYNTSLVGLPRHFVKLNLTMEQVDLLTTLREKLEEYKNILDEGIISSDETATKMGVSFRPEITYFWGKLINLRADSKAESPASEVRLFRHHSAKFFQKLSEQITDSTQIRNDGGHWITKYFNRNVGKDTSVLSINTQLQQGFQLQFNFIEGAPYELTQEDIDIAVDLNSVGYDVTNFDIEEMKGLLERVTSYINLAKSSAQANIGVVPVPNTTAQYQTPPANMGVPTNIPNPSITTQQVGNIMNNGGIVPLNNAVQGANVNGVTTPPIQQAPVGDIMPPNSL